MIIENIMKLYIDYNEDGTFPGWGNQLIVASQYYKLCKDNGYKPVIYTKHPEYVVNFKPGVFEFSEVSTNVVKIPINLRSVFNKEYVDCYKHIIQEIDVELPNDIDAGFSFRFETPEVDGIYRFGNKTSIDTMKQLIRNMKRVYVTSNKDEFIDQLITEFGSKIVCHRANKNDKDTRENRNSTEHLKKWVALSKCPRVVHFVRALDDPPEVITTTYAPTAALYGNKQLIGVDSYGKILHGHNYHW